MNRFIVFFVSVLVTGTLIAQQQNGINGVLRKSAENPRYFTDDTGKVIFLTGSHTWANFQEHYTSYDTTQFDWHGYLDMMVTNNHNFMRFWMYEHPKWHTWTVDTTYVDPMPYNRTGSALAGDGKPKFNLDSFNQDYFDRIRKRVIEAGDKGIYVSILLFQGWSQNKMGNKKVNPFDSHPFNKNNNLNGVDVIDSHADYEDQPTLHSLGNKKALTYQEAYVRKVIETVNDLDNVLYEIVNEGGTDEWIYHMIRYIKQVESKMPKQHMVGAGSRISPPMLNQVLWDSPADYISPSTEPVGYSNPGGTPVQDYGNDPPANNGDKVVILDTDHVWGIWGHYKWVWKSLCRGLNPIFMDPWWPAAGHFEEDSDLAYIGGISTNQRDHPDYDLLRKNMGYARTYALKMDLIRMAPREDLATTKYCLANPEKEYLIYLPNSGRVTVDLTSVEGEMTVEWFIPVTGQVMSGPKKIKGGYFANFTAPFIGDAVLYLKKE